MPGGNQKNKDFVFRWSPEMAYAIGLLTTDGNLSKDGRHTAPPDFQRMFEY